MLHNTRPRQCRRSHAASAAPPHCFGGARALLTWLAALNRVATVSRGVLCGKKCTVHSAVYTDDLLSEKIAQALFCAS